ncbi:MAG: PhnD/SsuA/transferrin family substrate-binding protein [Solobacterium sp.]|nr:PhnD/SsuA/transferrin family substrate-binding protein [Solobacterium sp.]
MKKLMKAAAALALVLTAGCSTQQSAETPAETPAEEPVEEAVTVRVGSLKGPTSLGLLNMMDRAERNETEGTYEFNIVTAADEMAANVVQGNVDIALVPANLASVLYKKTEGKVTVIDINTLGVLYCVSADDSITGVKDLAGKTVVTTGQGTTPEFSLRYLLKEYGVEDCNIEFKSEATEVVIALQQDPSLIAVLPQPFATAAQIKNETLKANFALGDAWDELNNGSRMVTGVTIVRNDFLAEHPGAVNKFLHDHFGSVDASKDVDATAELAVKYGIVEAAPVAKKALPNCALVCLTGEEMTTALSGYLQVLFDADPASVGGALPEDGFYYVQ